MRQKGTGGVHGTGHAQLTRGGLSGCRVRRGHGEGGSEHSSQTQRSLSLPRVTVAVAFRKDT